MAVVVFNAADAPIAVVCQGTLLSYWYSQFASSPSSKSSAPLNSGPPHRQSPSADGCRRESSEASLYLK